MFSRGGLASLPGCPVLSNLCPVVSLRSTTGYTLECLRHSLEGRPAIQLSARTILGTGCLFVILAFLG